MYKVLIADDEELELKSMRVFFERNYPNLQILPDAINGTEVVEMSVRENPDILILDIEMPGLSGLKALKMLRNQGFSGHVIVKTAYGKFTYAQDAVHLHVDAYLLKPVKKTEIKEHLDIIIQKLNSEMKEIQSHNSRSKIFGGFVVSIVFEQEEITKPLFQVELEQLCQIISRQMALICDFTICPLEKNILPILVYSSSCIDEFTYRNLKEDIIQLIDNISQNTFKRKIKIQFGCLIENIYEQLPQTYLTSVDIQLNDKSEDNSMNAHLQRAIAYMRKYYSEDISLDDLSSHIKINPSYLSHLFKKEMNRSFVEYLTQIRMEEALRLIDQGICNVKELAERTGYQYATYFSKQFKRYTGYTVSEYKRLNK